MKDVELGVFLPVGRGGWIPSVNSPDVSATYGYNREVTLLAEELGFDLALSMAWSVATGTPFAGREVAKGCALYLNFDLPARDFARVLDPFPKETDADLYVGEGLAPLDGRLFANDGDCIVARGLRPRQARALAAASLRHCSVTAVGDDPRDGTGDALGLLRRAVARE